MVCTTCGLSFRGKNLQCHRCRYNANRDVINRRTIVNRERRIFGIEPEDRLKEGICPLCLKHSKLVIDHKHGEGKVRGFICSNCNRSLGFMGDDWRTALRMVKYLRGI